ncbi:MAG: hypothetical protein IKV61_03595 [Clostridia bacterium]|nr:hypothetical protein [Clostridia bacterium]
MKKLLKIGTLLLTVIMLFNLTACSSFGKVQKALETIGYEIIEGEETEASKEAEKDDSVAKIHMFTNANTLSLLEGYKVTLVTVIEFKSTKELVEYFKESNTLQGIVQDLEDERTIEEIYEELKDEGLACGNCLIVPIGFDTEAVLEAIDEVNG